MKTCRALMALSFLFVSLNLKAQKVETVDICIYGGSSSGIVAAYAAKKMGKSVLVIEPGKYIGGLTTGGLGATDIGNKYAITGLARDFYRRLGSYYGKFEQWTFEPHKADQVFDDLIGEAKLNIVKNHRLLSVKKSGSTVQEITVEDSENPRAATNRTVRAKVFLDCTYEGDLMARAGVSYTIGREDNSQYGETYNGVQLSDYHQMPDGIDPYVVPGKPESGLVWGVSDQKLQPKGTGDKLIQAYNFRLCLTQESGNMVPFTKPDNYNPAHYTLLARVIAKEGWRGVNGTFKTVKNDKGETIVNNTGNFLIKYMPNGKTDFNNFGGFSTDMIGMNYDYPEGDYETRKKIWKQHEDYTKGMLYFLAHDPGVPESVRKDMQSWGYAKDEFKDLGGFSNQLYVREARRMVGELVMTQKHCEGVEVVQDAIGMAAYGMDSHNCQRIVVNGMVKNEGDVQKRVLQPYPISYRAIVPKQSECTNLLVPVCLSASHIAFGSIRMEPVFMVMGQAAATAAVMAIDGKVPVQQVDVKKLQDRLMKDPLVDGRPVEVLVDNDNEQAVVVKGDWELVRGGYGKNLFISRGNTNPDMSVKYTPVLEKKGKYGIFVYLPKVEDVAGTIDFVIHNGKKNELVSVKTSEIKQLGLSSGEWAELGTYELPAGKSAFVEIKKTAGPGTFIADAVIFKPL